MGEVIFIVCLVGGLLTPWFFLHGKTRLFWAIMMGTIMAIFGGTEILAVVTDGRTISQMYWEWSVAHPETSWVAMGIFALGWISLIVHLQWKVVRDKNYKGKGEK